MKKTIASFFVLCALLFSACGEATAYAPLVVQADAPVHSSVRPAEEPIQLALQILINDHPLALYEPTEGALLGAYMPLESEGGVGGISAFEEAVGVTHAIFATSLTLGEEYPLRWVLENIAMGKAPKIVVNLPAGDHSISDLAPALEELAAETGRIITISDGQIIREECGGVKGVANCESA